MTDTTPAEKAVCMCAPQWPGHECIVRTPAEEAAASYLNEWSVRLYDGEIRELLTIVRPIIEADALRAAAAELRTLAARRAAETQHIEPIWRTGVLVDADWLDARAARIAREGASDGS